MFKYRLFVHCGTVVHLQCIWLSTEITIMQIICSEVRCIWLTRASHCFQLCNTKQKATVSLVVWVIHSPHHWHFNSLTLTLLTWRIWWAPNNASKWQMGFNLAFEGLSGIGTRTLDMGELLEFCCHFCTLGGLLSLARHWQYC